MQYRIILKLKMIIKQCKQFEQNILESILYHYLKSRRNLTKINKIIFVCKGNICRSAFAEYLMKSITISKLFSIESCGLNVDKRMPAPFATIITAKKFGLDLGCHLSKGWEMCELEDADLILAMEFWQYRKLVELFPNKKENIALLLEFAPFPENLLCNINDPYGQSEKTFEKCFSKINRSIKAMVAQI